VSVVPSIFGIYSVTASSEARVAWNTGERGARSEERGKRKEERGKRKEERGAKSEERRARKEVGR
jgi:hypothetical protein